MIELDELNIKQGNRVLRTGTTGPKGTVKQIRVESIRQTMRTGEGDPLGVTVTVLWDNGTLGHFVPDGLEVAE